MKVIGFALTGSVLALTIASCARHEETKLVNPAPPGETTRVDVAEAHWIDRGPELLRVAGLGTDGIRYRATILPYADPNDPNRATFLTLLSRDGFEMCQRSELLASETRVSPDSGYSPITLFDQTFYIREGEPYVPASDGSARLSPERFNKVRFMSCFVAGMALVGRVSESFCTGMPDYPRCVAISTGVGTAAMAVGCGIWAFSK